LKSFSSAPDYCQSQFSGGGHFSKHRQRLQVASAVSAGFNEPAMQPQFLWQRCQKGLNMQDIDYAAVAVKKAIVEKYGRAVDLNDLEVVAGERAISVQHGDKVAEGTRDNLLAAVRKADTYESLWQLLQASGAQLSSSRPV
jgi:hypothetical protein